ncbi:UDP-glucuronosyltransferase 3A2-like isoform X2 [Photinus pyralis]|uniref:UDP-glucuronosyltransferase 3A2-like isoform X2 n=1 Tax=Photinus pyralis TaxID=7054 RepID=UPI0012674DC8|nr:UDP-glucuronosyltransferase 3A2-like isoform X2 [Photinus pyralis]
MNVVLLLLIRMALSANILYIVPLGSPSHVIWNRALAVSLNDKGHNVTMVTHTEEKQKIKNFHTILLEGFYEKKYEAHSLESLSKRDAFSNIKARYDYSFYSCVHDLETEGFKTLLNYPKDFNFALIIFDITNEGCLYPLIQRFNNPPVVAVTTFLLSPALAHVFGNPMQAAYFPFYSTKHTDRMIFVERMKNFLLIHFEILYRRYISLPAELKLAKQYFGENIRDFEEVERNMSLLICNYDPLLSFPLALAPNIVPAGGLHIEPVKPLPVDLKKIVEDAQEGLVIFALGSYFRSDQLSITKRTAILDAFAKLPQTVLWKFESEITDLPKNVFVRKWLPQNDLLGNCKTKLLITHGGALSTQEAMYHGVPVIVVPFFIDQHANGEKLADRRMGKVRSSTIPCTVKI